MTVLLVCGIVWANPDTMVVSRSCWPARIFESRRRVLGARHSTQEVA